MLEFTLKIVTPEKVLFDQKVSQVSVSTALGQITILAHHLPLISKLQPGEIVVKHDGSQEALMVVSSGLLEVLPEQVVILADTAERAEEIDEARAAEAHRRAQELLKTKFMDAREFAFLSAQMEKELARLRVARKYKTRGIRTSLRSESEREK